MHTRQFNLLSCQVEWQTLNTIHHRLELLQLEVNSIKVEKTNWLMVARKGNSDLLLYGALTAVTFLISQSVNSLAPTLCGS